MIDITGKLPSGLVKIYSDIEEQADVLKIKYIVVGAMARDLILVHGFDADIERGTRDIDFAVHVASWDEFDRLKINLTEIGYRQDNKMPHRLITEDHKGLSWDIDIVPFGGIEDKDKKISWPPENEIVMNTLGFTEAVEHALTVQISDNPAVMIPVASPAGICLLKLISWLDRENRIKSQRCQ